MHHRLPQRRPVRLYMPRSVVMCSPRWLRGARASVGCAGGAGCTPADGWLPLAACRRVCWEAVSCVAFPPLAVAAEAVAVRRVCSCRPACSVATAVVCADACALRLLLCRQASRLVARGWRPGRSHQPRGALARPGVRAGLRLRFRWLWRVLPSAPRRRELEVSSPTRRPAEGVIRLYALVGGWA